MLFASEIAPIVSFAGTDVVLSLLMLFLFAYPLYRHLKGLKAENMDTDPMMFSVLRRNMILSTLITVSTSTNLIIMT